MLSEKGSRCSGDLPELARNKREELAAARQLLESGFPRQAISRAYYAAFYAAQAALKATGTDLPKTHAGLRSKFSELAHTAPDVGADVGRALSQLESGRTEADYGNPTISADEAGEAIAKAEHVVDVIERALTARGSDARTT